MNEIAIAILQASGVLAAVVVALWLLFQAYLRVMFHLKWRHE